MLSLETEKFSAAVFMPQTPPEYSVWTVLPQGGGEALLFFRRRPGEKHEKSTHGGGGGLHKSCRGAFPQPRRPHPF